MSFRFILLILLILFLCLFTMMRGNVYAAIGDAVPLCTSVVASGDLDIQPPGSDEWIIYNINFTKNVQLTRFDGSLTSAGPSWIGPDWQNFIPGFYVTNASYLRITNLDGAVANIICYDGVQTG